MKLIVKWVKDIGSLYVNGTIRGNINEKGYTGSHNIIYSTAGCMKNRISMDMV